MPTIKDVAQLAGVSVATVSRHINNSGYVSEKSKEKVVSAIKSLNYMPNEVARSLNKKTSKLIGLLVPQIDNPFFYEIMSGVESVCTQKGYQVIVGNASNKNDGVKYIESFISNNIAGIISAIGSIDDCKTDCPLITIDRDTEKFKYSVGFDEVLGGQIAANAILQSGAKKILVNSGPMNIDVAKHRMNGIIDVLNKSNQKYDIYESNGYGYDSAMKFVDYLENCDTEYDSIIACNDLHALCAALYINRKGYEIPDDVQIIGYDDVIFSKVFNPKISTISHDAKTLGNKAAKMILEIIEKGDVLNKKIELKPYLIKNKSLRTNNNL